MIIDMASEKYKVLLDPKRYKLIYGGRGGGKSYTVALMMLLFSLEKKRRILCTRYIQRSIKDSVHKLLKDIIDKYEWQNFFDVKNDSIVSVNGSEFIFKGLWNNIQEIKSTEGIDYCWVEEAQSISQEALDILIPTIRQENSEIWFTFNRFSEFEPVWTNFVIKNHPEHLALKINYEDNRFCPAVLKKEAEFCKSTNLSEYLHIWQGEPLTTTSSGIIDKDKLLEATKRIISDEGRYVVGVDVARFGDDRTVFMMRKGLKMIKIKVLEKKDTVEVSNELKLFIENKTLTTINIDDTGVGGGVSDNMIHDGYIVNKVNFGSTAKDMDSYTNKISELWFDFASCLDDIQISDDYDLLQELLSRRYGYDKKQRRMVESKDEYKRRNLRSPDLADACLLCFMGVAEKQINYNDILNDLDKIPDREILNF
jgi:phage terminase large subunit